MVRQGDQFLLVQERKFSERWYLPAGRVEPGESLMNGAKREALEEAGVPIALTGVLKIQHTPDAHGARLRVVFLGEPTADVPPLAPPGNEHSLQAAWVTYLEAQALPLRGREVLTWMRRASEGPVYPMDVLGFEDG